MDYSREIYAERDRADNDYWDARALLPTEKELEAEDKPDEPEELDGE